MKLPLIILLLCIATASFAQKKSKNLIARNYFAGITATSTIDDLYKIFGEDNVKEDIDYGPEGTDSIPITTVYTNSSREFLIFWKEGKFHQQPAFVECMEKKSPYKTEQGISIGTTLAELVTKNKRPVEFMGLGWDYGGSILSFNKGNLDKAWFTFTLSATGPIPEKLTGDVKLNTDMPVVKKYLTKIAVSSIILHFD